jgi:NADH-quinone oxidoreductase subunit A
VIRSYLPAIVFLLLGTVVGGAFALLNTVLGPRRRIPAKVQPYECGLPSEVKRGFRFGISFYMIGMLFILFDTEVFFFAPIAIHLRAYGLYALVETITFVVLLVIALVYVWRRGALEWR